jgi:hypothetical protein
MAFRQVSGGHLHIAVAAVNSMVLVTWNFAHLNNPFTRMRVREIVEAEDTCAPKSIRLTTLEADK